MKSTLPAQSPRSEQADGTALLTSPVALGLHYVDDVKAVAGLAVGEVCRIPVPADLPNRRMFVWIQANAATAGDNVEGDVELLQNNSVIVRLPVRIVNSGASGFNIASSLAANYSPPFEPALSFNYAALLYTAGGLPFKLQFDIARLVLARNTCETARYMGLAIISGTL